MSICNVQAKDKATTANNWKTPGAIVSGRHTTILEEDPIDCVNKVAIYDDYCDDVYAIKNNHNHETCHQDFNFQLDYDSHDSYFVELLPLFRMRRILLMCRILPCHHVHCIIMFSKLTSVLASSFFPLSVLSPDTLARARDTFKILFYKWPGNVLGMG